MFEVVGAGGIFYLGMRAGLAYARALRSWRDLVATKRQIRGLFQNVVHQWRAVVGVAFVMALAMVGLIGWVWIHA